MQAHLRLQLLHLWFLNNSVLRQPLWKGWKEHTPWQWQAFSRSFYSSQKPPSRWEHGLVTWGRRATPSPCSPWLAPLHTRQCDTTDRRLNDRSETTSLAACIPNHHTVLRTNASTQLQRQCHAQAYILFLTFKKNMSFTESWHQPGSCNCTSIAACCG